MAELFRSLDAAARRIRAVMFFRALQQHLIIVVSGLLLIAFLDKVGIIPLVEWQRPESASGWMLFPLPLLYRQIILGALALSLFGAALRARLAAFTAHQIALLLDERLCLAERLVSADTADRALPMAATLLADAERCCHAIRPAEIFIWSPGRGGYITFAAIAAYAAVLFLVPPADILGKRHQARAQQARLAEERKAVAAMASALRQEAQRLAEERKNSPDIAMPEDLIKRLEALAKRLQEDRTLDTQQAQELINRLQDEMREIAEKAAQQAAQVAGLKSPRDKRSLLKEMADKIRDQRAAEAADAMKRLRRRLQKNELSQDDLMRLSKDMAEMSEQMAEQGLEELSKAFDDLADDLKDLQNSGDWQRLQKLQEQMAKALQEMPGKKLDHSQLTDEEREMLRRLQKALAQMEITEDMLKQMEQALAEGKVRRLSAEDLRQMLEDLKRGESGKQGDSGATSLVGVPMPTARGAAKGDSQNSRSGERLPGPPGTEHADLALKDKAEDGEVSADPVRVRAQQVAAGSIVAEWFERGIPDTKDGVKSAYAAAMEEAAESPEAKSEREAVPREERMLIRDYLSRLRQTGE